MYFVIVTPPLEAGGSQLTTAFKSPETAWTPVGESGTVIGVTALDATEAALVPAALVAVTVKV